MEPHLRRSRASSPGVGRSPSGDALAVVVDADGRLVRVLDRPDDVQRTPRRVAAEEDAGARAREGRPCRPRGNPTCRSRSRCPARSTGTPPPGRWRGSRRRRGGRRCRWASATSLPFSSLRLVPLELHPLELPGLDDERLRLVVDDDLDLLLLGVLELPGEALKYAARLPRHHLDVLAAEPARRAAAIHRRVADADDEDLLADLRPCAPKATDSRASRCRCGCGRSRSGPGISRFLPRGAPLPTKIASKPCSRSRFMLSTGESSSGPRCCRCRGSCSISSSRTARRQAERRGCSSA